MKLSIFKVLTKTTRDPSKICLKLFKSVITLTSLFVLLRWRSNSCFALSLRTTWKSRIKTPWSEFKRVKRIAIHSLPLAKYVNPRIQVMPKIHIREADPKNKKKIWDYKKNVKCVAWLIKSIIIWLRQPKMYIQTISSFHQISLWYFDLQTETKYPTLYIHLWSFVIREIGYMILINSSEKEWEGK